MRQKGFALIAIIILITFVAVAVSASTSFVMQRLSGFNTDQIALRCRYNAQAGLQYALYQYRQSGTFTSGTVNIDSNNYCVVSTVSGGEGSSDAESLLIDARSSYLDDGNKSLKGITIEDTSASSITIDRMIVDWDNKRDMQQIWINGIQVWPAGGGDGSATHPANVDINNFTLSPGTTYPLTKIKWDNSVHKATITLQFQMVDTTLTSVCTVSDSPPTTCQAAATVLTIKSMGKVTGSDIFKSVQATYTVSTGNISDYKEYLGSVP